MSLCEKCNEIVQSAASKNIMKKREEIMKKFGLDSDEMKNVKTDPFVIMWVPEPESTKPPPPPKFYPPDPCCPEYDITVDMTTGAQECKERVYPIRPRKPKDHFA